LIYVLLLIVSVVISIASLFYSRNTEVVLKEKIDELESEIGRFNEIFAKTGTFESIQIVCPGNKTGNLVISDKGIYQICE